MTPEQQEIEKKKTEIHLLEEQLTELDASYADISVELSHFEQRYLKVIAPLYQRLDQWNMRLDVAERMLDKLRSVREGVFAPPEDPFLWELEAIGEVRQIWLKQVQDQEQSELQEGLQALSEHQALEAKSVYRSLARRFHPDLAEHDEIRAARQQVMIEINEAYQKRDLVKLRELQHRPDLKDPDQESVGETLIRLIRRIAQLRRLVEEAQERIEERKQSDLGILQEQLLSQNPGHPSDQILKSVEQMLQSRLEQAKHLWLNQRVREAQLWTELEE